MENSIINAGQKQKKQPLTMGVTASIAASPEEKCVTLERIFNAKRISISAKIVLEIHTDLEEDVSSSW